MHPRDRLTPSADAIEQGMLHPCCLREENLTVAEYVAQDRMVRVCRHCKAKHHTMRILPGRLRGLLGPLSSARRQAGGGRHMTMGLGAGEFDGRDFRRVRRPR